MERLGEASAMFKTNLEKCIEPTISPSDLALAWNARLLSKEHQVSKYDLEALWEEHCRCEFETRDVDATMATMVKSPYVNHIPTMTGGVGHDQLKRFYKYHFIGANPPDISMVPISRTVGRDRLVDEMLASFTHTCEIDWMLPGVPPTGRKVEVPIVAIVQFCDGKLVHEHIYWDQASVLVQIGLLDPSKLPVTGVAEARKVADKTLPSNALMTSWAKSEGQPI
jgi:carboxymethylenebutenolidase